MSTFKTDIKQQLYRPTWAEVDLGAIRHNVLQLMHFLRGEKEIMAVVKADGYGHGAVPVAQAAQAAGATWLGVALMEEAISLRQAELSLPILVLGDTDSLAIPLAQELEISITVHDLDAFKEVLEQINPQAKPLRVHVKVDTGMNRLGLKTIAELEEILSLYTRAISQGLPLVWEGLFTHFATADAEDHAYMQWQEQLFDAMLKNVQSQINLKYVHTDNSAGSIYTNTKKHTNLIRFGISMYGLYPSGFQRGIFPFELKPAFSLYTELTKVKCVPQNTAISYGGTYVTSQETWIGTVPIGYADGWSRGLSNKAEAIIDGEIHRFVGNICMDQAMIELGKEVSRRTKVTLIGGDDHLAISMDEVAALLGTINYEIPCMISKRVPRIYINKKS